VERRGAPRLLHLPSRFHQLFKSCARPSPALFPSFASTVPGNPCRYVSCDSPRTRESPLSVSLSLSFSFHAAHVANGAQQLPFYWREEERFPRPDNEIEAKPLPKLRDLDASNTPDDRASAFPIQAPAGYFRRDVSRAKCALVSGSIMVAYA